MTEQEQFLRGAMERQGSTVYRLALCRLQSREDAEDVYQDVFLHLLSQGGRDWDEEHLKAWLIRATLNRCADLHRFRLRRPVLALEELPDRRGVGAVGGGGPPAGEATHSGAPLLRRGLPGGGDRLAHRSPGGYGPHPAAPGSDQTERFAGRYGR